MSEGSKAMTRSALQARSYRVLSEQLQRLRTPAERDHFMQGAHDALTWLVEGRSAPLTGRLNWPIHGHDVADERAVATALAHQDRSPSQEYAAGVQHTLMWAQSADVPPPADVRKVGC
jgi:hypothetical protein